MNKISEILEMIVEDINKYNRYCGIIKYESHTSIKCLKCFWTIALGISEINKCNNDIHTYANDKRGTLFKGTYSIYSEDDVKQLINDIEEHIKKCNNGNVRLPRNN